jgi:D-amino-acid oxidase
VTAADLDVLIVGAGVSGLTTGVCLAEAGLRVRIWTAEPPQTTTSVAAGAMWGPYLVEPVDRVRVWSQRTLEELRKLATDPATGVHLVSGIEASRTRTHVEPPDWGDRLDGFRLCDASELPEGFATGWRFTAPAVDMPIYLAYLERRFAAAGGSVEIQRLRSLRDAPGSAAILVNCAGIGAHELVPDLDLVPIRGQLVVVENLGITEFFSEDTGLSPDLLHFCPHGETLVLGGTAQPGAWNREPDPVIAAAIVDRCAKVEPRLRDARIVGHRVGLRPTRPQIRLQAQTTDRTIVIHNYGHGGAGVSLSWGCAREVLELVHATPATDAAASNG